MKNNKKALYILVPLVIFIWGMIVYRIFDFSADEDDSKINMPLNMHVAETNEIDSFELFLSYSDPFLGKDYLFEKIEQKEEDEEKIKEKQNQPTFNNPMKHIFWPKIEYLGIAMNNKEGKKVVVLTINKKEFLMSEGNKSEKVSLVEVYKDSVHLEFNNEIKTFERLK